MSRKSVLDLYPTVSTEAMVPAPETVVPLVFESEPEVLDETTELEGQIQETLAPTSNFTSQMVAAEQYLQVLTKFNQLDTQVSQEVYDTVRTTLGLESSDQPLSQRVINFIKDLYRKAVEAIKKAAVFIKRVFFSYEREFKNILRDVDRLSKAFIALPPAVTKDTEPVLNIKTSDITTFSLHDHTPAEARELLFNICRFTTEVLSLIRQINYKPFPVPGNRILHVEQVYGHGSYGSVHLNTILVSENFSLTVDPRAKEPIAEVSINSAARLFTSMSDLERHLNGLTEAAGSFEQLSIDASKDLKDLDSIFEDTGTLAGLKQDTADQLSDLVRIRDRMKYTPELLKYFTTILKNDIKIGEQILQIAKSKQ